MAWDHLDIDKPHLAYMILGGFTGLFMLCSLFVKEKLYIGEATVATICGIIFGPHAANLFNPLSWGNVDKITLECSRIVLVVQCFAVGVELPKAYMERHWKSVFFLLVPVMTWGWLITSLFIWWMVPLNWIESLVCAACVTATDPVLASSVVGKGKFARRVPKHLRDLLSAESGCNDGMAFPFIYLSFYILRHMGHPNEVALHWICVTILYECILGAIFGFTIGYVARHAIKFAERKQLIDRESFLVFYFVLAVFCAGAGSLLGMDDLLIGFACGVGFSNDGWFTEKTEESHVSNVIDLLLNLAYFVYFGSIVPWEDYNNAEIGLTPWRLVVIALLVIFFRRIPIMLLCKPLIPDMKTWREALFAGHFGPIGVGAIFACILARAELETDSTQPLSEGDLPKAGTADFYVVQLIWPITTFLVISSILVHGSSIAVFTLGKRINTLTITLSYTTANEEGPSWMNRLPRVQSLAKGSMSFRKADEELENSSNEPEYPPGTLPPIGVPGNFLRRVRDEDTDTPSIKPPHKTRRRRRRRRVDDGAGGPISQSAIMPQRHLSTGEERKAEEAEAEREKETRDDIERGGSPPSKERELFHREPAMEVYLEGHNMIIEDEEGNVLRTEDISHVSPEARERHIEEERNKLQQEKTGEHAKSKSQPHEKTEGEEIQHAVGETTGHPLEKARKRLGQWMGFGKAPATDGASTQPGAEHDQEAAEKDAAAKKKAAKAKARSAHAYQFGNTIIVEDEDGEVIKKYSIPSSSDKPEAAAPVRRGLTRMGTWFGVEGGKEGESSTQATPKKPEEDEWLRDDGLRFTVAEDDQKGRRMNKHEFVQQLRNLGPKARRDLVEQTGTPERVKDAAREADRQESATPGRPQMTAAGRPDAATDNQDDDDEFTSDSELATDEEDTSDEPIVPGDNVAASLARFRRGTAAEDRRSNLTPTPGTPRPRSRRDSEDDGTERVPPAQLREAAGLSPLPRQASIDDTGETPAERRRRLAALGQLNSSDDEEDSDAVEDDEDDSEESPNRGKVQFADGTKPARSREAGNSERNGSGSGSSNSPSHRPRISWGGEKGRED
ncbi:Na+/H+ antiporter Nha1 [Aspergillus terreus]|uniref:Na+/H+ antiporter Nha1 n=1 Tax=Aspergillus terreus TaxID=33178 RepID=A0A5M3ZD18_ASPTE|nr:hypothetical protein ATETN484_0016006800 [Aspergillus terreus]GFF21497.1 Na+/H+ antiporter Nha1 [Aspergillus terreus]